MCLLIIDEKNNNIFTKRQFILLILDFKILEKNKKTINTSSMDDDDPFLCTLNFFNYLPSGDLYDN